MRRRVRDAIAKLLGIAGLNSTADEGRPQLRVSSRGLRKSEPGYRRSTVSANGLRPFALWTRWRERRSTPH
jgi:hypothetical protein